MTYVCVLIIYKLFSWSEHIWRVKLILYIIPELINLLVILSLIIFFKNKPENEQRDGYVRQLEDSKHIPTI